MTKEKMTDQTGGSNSNTFQAKRIISSYEEKIKASLAQIFPLACPIQEYKWIDGWRCEMVYSKSGLVENNCIFKEDLTGSFLFNSPIETMIWVVSLYDPDNFRIQFVLVSGEMIGAKLDMEGKDLGNGISSITWTFTLTSLSEEGNKVVDATTEEKVLAMLTFLGKSLKHYCETGEMLRINRLKKWLLFLH